MVIREVLEKDKAQFNLLATHPLQAWEWGEFRQRTGLKVIRLGQYEGKVLKAGFQITVHPIPKLPYTVLYLGKSVEPNAEVKQELAKIGQQEKAIFIKIEPNLNFPVDQTPKRFPNKPFFHRYSFYLDLQKTETELLAAMKSKTRYNIRLADRRGVKVVKNNRQQTFEIFWQLTNETTQRQGFYAHTKDYHFKLWQTLKNTDIYHLFLAKYQGKVLAAYVFFVFNNVLYYPYGASSREHPEVMAPYALLWQAIKFGQKLKCHTFDLWGNLGPIPDPQDPWFGVHRFKAGFGGQLMESSGAYDLVFKPSLYPIYQIADKLRWAFLKRLR